MALPQFRSAGTQGSGLGAGMSLGLPAGTIDGDLHLLAIGTYNQAITLYGGKEEGFVAIPDAMVGLGTGGSAGSIRGTLFGRIRGTGATNAPVVGDSGAVQWARIFAFSGQALADYLAVLGTPNTQAATTSGSADGGTTVTDENLILAFLFGSGPDSTGADMSSPANASLASVTERADQATDDASGGWLGLITGEQAAAGVVGATTYTTATSAAKANIVLSLTSGAAGGGGSGWPFGGLAGGGALAGPGGLAGRGGGLAARSMTKVNGIWQQTKEIIRPRLIVPVGISLAGAR